MTSVEIEDLRFSYGERVALDGLRFSVGEGEVFALLGPNGSGKSTLFKVLSTLLPPGGGRVAVSGHELPREAEAVRRGIGVVFQSPSLDVQLTVRENLTHQGHLYGLRGRELRERIGRALDLVRLADRAGERAKSLSGGMKRRVELAKGLLHDPRVLLLDEPSTGLDPAARRDVLEHLCELRERRGVTSVLTTHLMEEAERCDRVAILDEGQLVALGTPQELRAAVGDEVVTVVPRSPDRLEALRVRIWEKLELDAPAVGGALRIEGRCGPDDVARVLAAVGADAASVTVGKPTLEDVFLARTGRVFT